MLCSWKHSGLNIHRSQRLAQDLISNPFLVEKMRPNSSGDPIIHRSGMNPRIGRNLEVFSPCDFTVRIIQHIPDKSFQLVGYHGWDCNKMRGQWLKRAGPEAGAASGGDVSELSEPKHRRIPSKKWSELIKKVREADPLLCPHCQQEMRILPSSTRLRSSGASCATSGCGRLACGSMQPATRPSPKRGSSSPGSRIHSPTTTPNRCSRRTQSPGSD